MRLHPYLSERMLSASPAVAPLEAVAGRHHERLDGYVIPAGMRVVMDDGGEVELRPGDVASIPPGHDAEVVGDEPCVTVDLGEADADYAKRR